MRSAREEEERGVADSGAGCEKKKGGTNQYALAGWAAAGKEKRDGPREKRRRGPASLRVSAFSKLKMQEEKNNKKENERGKKNHTKI